LETTNGKVYYDNNGGVNYRLEPYIGRGTSASIETRTYSVDERSWMQPAVVKSKIAAD